VYEHIDKQKKTLENMNITPHKASNDFSILMASVIKELKKNESENLEIIKDICSYLPTKDNPDVLLFNEEELKAIIACNQIRVLFRQHLRGCWRWDEFSILKAIIQHLDSDICEKLLSQYELKFYCQMKLEEIYEQCKEDKLDIPRGYHRLVAVVRNKIFSRITKDEYDELKGFIAENCGVNECTIFPFYKAAESSLRLEWSIPSTAISLMVKTATRNFFKFIMNSFVYLRISTKVIIDRRKFNNVRMYCTNAILINVTVLCTYVHT